MSSENQKNSQNQSGADAASSSSGNSFNQDDAGSSQKAEGSNLDPLAAAQEEVTKWKNEYLYLRAEFDNYRKQTIKERSDLLKYSGERVLKEVLEVMDNFERALSTPATPELHQNFRTGVEMTAKELRDVLTKSGVQELPCEGAPFNPLQHEAISSEPTDKFQPGHVCRVFKKPYKFHEKILRLGQVVVATAPQNNRDVGN